MRDTKTEEAKKHINQGVKIKMDEQGNILIKRLCKNNVYIKPTSQEDNAIGAEIARNSQGALEHEKPGKVSVPRYILLRFLDPSTFFFHFAYTHTICVINLFPCHSIVILFKSVTKVFDMNKFQTNLSRETRRAYPDRRRLEMQCLSAIVFVKTEPDLLQCPVWVLIVNVVGLDMLKSKLPPGIANQRFYRLTVSSSDV